MPITHNSDDGSPISDSSPDQKTDAPTAPSIPEKELNNTAKQGVDFTAIINKLLAAISVLAALFAAVAPVNEWVKGYWQQEMERTKLVHEIASQFLNKALDTNVKRQDRILVFEALASLGDSPLKNWGNLRLRQEADEQDRFNSLALDALPASAIENAEQCKARIKTNITVISIQNASLLRNQQYTEYSLSLAQTEKWVADEAARCGIAPADVSTPLTAKQEVLIATAPDSCELPDPLKQRLLSKKYIFDLSPSASKTIVTDALVAELVRGFQQNGMCDKALISAIMANIVYETDNFRTIVEYSNGERYEGRQDLGNTSPGDGRRYKGRGLFQVTGRANYLTLDVTLKLGGKLIDNPDLLTTDNAILVNAAFWFIQKANLKRALQTDGSIDMVFMRRRVNGGLNGLDSVQLLFNRARVILG